MKRIIITLAMAAMAMTAVAQNNDDLFEDRPFTNEGDFFTSANVDFIRIPSSVTPNTESAAAIYKPDKPSPILLMSHGWHMSVKPPTPDSRNPMNGFLTIQVDMRGRKYSTGMPDCNGLELFDFYDAYKYALQHYADYISDPSQVYYYGSSGGGGNGFAIVGKFPDLFCSALASCGISDYAEWYRQDSIRGEFRDELEVWIGGTPATNPTGYASRSGITTIANVLTPVYTAHGDMDLRVSVEQARMFVERMKAAGKQVEYLEFAGVGTRDHWGNITREQTLQRREMDRRAMAYHPAPVLPEKGNLIVAGYVVTKHFTVFMNSLDDVGEISYDLRRHKIKFLKGKGTVTWTE